MINEYVSISLKDPNLGNLQYFPLSSSSFYLKYPCSDKDKCTPYVITLERGYYLFECWGSAGGIWGSGNSKSTPGYGGYTSGELFIQSRTTFYVYIGNSGFFNAVKGLEKRPAEFSIGVPGGATDVRLITSDKWWDVQSLISRIMVAAGGGGTEWAASIGGNGGGINGGESTSATSPNGKETFQEKCSGAGQTSGTQCTSFSYKYTDADPYSGSFGSAGVPTKSNNDYGGFGGGGYYGGTSYYYAFGGSGGSSYISGHSGCNSVENSTTIKHTNSPYHYSDFVFRHTNMISGRNAMPLPFNNEHGIHSDEGAFRLTLLFRNLKCTCEIQRSHFMQLSSLFILVS